MLTVFGLPTGASAKPVHEIAGRWVDGTPAKVASGSVVTAEWRVNVNDDQPAPSNDMVDNVTFGVTLTNGVFDKLPDVCSTTGVDPASSLSDDKKTLTCDLGSHRQGTSVVVQAPVVVDGPTGGQVTAVGSIGDQKAAVPPLDITNRFGMDMRWDVGAANFTSTKEYFELDYEWTLSKGKGGDPGPQTVTYDLEIGSQQGGQIEAAPQGCTPYSIDARATGHPWSGGGHPAKQTASFVKDCKLTPTGPGKFQLTLSGIDYDPASPPALDSTGARLPSDRVALASGSVWVRVLTQAGGSAELKASAPTYTSTTGQTAEDDPANNRESKSWTTPGTYSAGWGRGYTGSGGTTWDDTYRVAAGTTVGQYMDTAYQVHTDRPDDRLVGMCSALDTKYVVFDGFQWSSPAAGVKGATTEYYTGDDAHLDPAGASYDPNGFDCGGKDGWSTTPPADPTQVRAVRVTATQGQMEAYSDQPHINQLIRQKIKPGTAPGTDVWTFFSGIVDTPLNNWWNGTGCILNTPGLRYPCTNGFRDLVRVTTASPAISKSADRAVVTPGVPSGFTLTYSANGAGAIPATVDGYKIVDTLPAGVTYVPKSATPEPAVTTDASGQQVLTWTLDGVTTNTDHALTYQAVTADSVPAGKALTNSATASYGDVTTAPATAQVTVATNGYTTIGKTPNAAFIPNVAGDGKGSGSWTVTLRSYDPMAQAFTDAIDILPHKGDKRGTSYSGSYKLEKVTPDAAGATVYYTTADPGSLSDDPGHASNGKAGDVTGNTVGWTRTFTPDATAVRVIGPSLAPGARQQFQVAVATDGAKGGDKLVNRAQARAGHTELVMRTSAPITVANHYSASLKKSVQGKDGKWHDANDAADYPVFRHGDEVRYRIVVTNTGEGTLKNVKVSDDKFPELGAFTIASLEPGKSESHEYRTVLDESAPGTLINTASATADTPPDAKTPPVIPPDPAGIEVTNYKVEKTADPKSGSAVQAGDKITYTVKVTQQGTAPADATLSDDLSKVLDDAAYNGDVKASLGTAEIKDGVLTWNGTVPVGGEATITYSVTAKAGGDTELVNSVLSPGCEPADDGSTPHCTTRHTMGSYVFAKTADPKPGSTVRAGDKVTYTVTVTQKGAGEVKDATVVDDLSKVLDDAAYNGDVKASLGTAEIKDGKLVWKGDLPVGGKATITYSVTVATSGGDAELHNVVTTPDDKRGHCATEKGCETDHTVRPGSSPTPSPSGPGSPSTSPSPSGPGSPSDSPSPSGPGSPSGSASPSGSPSPSGSVSPSGSAHPSGRPGPGGSPSGDVPPGDSGPPSDDSPSDPSPSGILARTGTAVLTTAGIAAALVLGGLCLTVVLRRRRRGDS
ncbi:DUF7927 domain-containing protein [Streptomyces varsoviensis]|uniref:DUF7927 domain-containing protein n=1 Tax=Streptomyces varsoviensis TaxID=67373 RepID=UPI000690F02F|nr:DUF11 domain-containing protein [Streptomyces varsoviensis]